MRYDVLIVTDEQEQFKNFKKYASKIMKNINITLSFECDDIYDAIEYADLLIIDINVHSYFNPLEDYLEKKVHAIFLVDTDLHLEKYSIIKKEDVLSFEAKDDLIAFMTTREDKLGKIGDKNCFIPFKYTQIVKEALNNYDEDFKKDFEKIFENYPFVLKNGNYTFTDPIQNKAAREGTKS